jgi:hypothetical protein
MRWEESRPYDPALLQQKHAELLLVWSFIAACAVIGGGTAEWLMDELILEMPG